MNGRRVLFLFPLLFLVRCGNPDNEKGIALLNEANDLKEIPHAMAIRLHFEEGSPLYKTQPTDGGSRRMFLKYGSPAEQLPPTKIPLNQIELDAAAGFDFASPKNEFCKTTHIEISFNKGKRGDVYLEGKDIGTETACDAFLKQILHFGFVAKYRNVVVRQQQKKIGVIDEVTIVATRK